MIWKDIEGYEGIYQVDPKGNVKSLRRYQPSGNGGFRTIKEKILNTSCNKKYPMVSLSKGCVVTRYIMSSWGIDDDIWDDFVKGKSDPNYIRPSERSKTTKKALKEPACTCGIAKAVTKPTLRMHSDWCDLIEGKE